jgi:DNA-binding transcriptional ArsR family regulator
MQTASGHLAKLTESGLLGVERQGRHRYFRLSGPDVAGTLESLMSLAQRTGATRFRAGPRDAGLRTARICYDHLAGKRGVELINGLLRRGYLEADSAPTVTARGRRFFSDFGIDMAELESKRRSLCRTCLDWSERRHHLAGALGAALLDRIVAQGWARLEPGRVIRFSHTGEAGFNAALA